MPFACSRRELETRVAPDPVAAAVVDTGVVVEAAPDAAPSYPVSEELASTLVARSRHASAKPPPNRVPRTLLYRRPPPGCGPTDAACGWTFGYGTEPILPNAMPHYIHSEKGSCFVHAFTGDATCTPTGKKAEPIGNALAAADAG